MDSVHLVFLFSFNQFTRLGNEIASKLRSFLVGGEEQGMEDTMHLPSRREVKAVGVRGNHLRDLERAFSLRGQFSGGEVDLRVTRINPDLRFYFPGGKLCSNPFLYSLRCFSVGGGGLLADGVQEFKIFVESGEEGLPNQWISSGFKAHHE